ncbi:MAG: 5-aminolevulinate synthase [Rickettsiaceae bacterium]|nr:5-aminolevulinate synthase [Rickettsiaceae bacterium]
MQNYGEIFQYHVSQIKEEGRYRSFLNIQRMAGQFPYALLPETGEKIIMWCINDYLGMGQKEEVITAALDAIKLMGTGAGGTRNIGGNNSKIVELENLLSSFHNKQNSLVFTSGYVANDAVLSTLSKIIPDIVFFSDEDNHASIIQGIRNSRCEKYIYKHLDVNSLEMQLKQVDINRPKLIVFESVYSMDGLESPIADICKLAKKYNALTYIDEVHTVGLYGNNGSGIARARGQDSEIDIIQGTLGKAIGVIGGYISTSFEIYEAIRLSAPGFIFTTAIPPSTAAAAIASINYIAENSSDRVALHEKVKILKTKLDLAGINYIHNNSHIVPIIIGDAILTKEASNLLLRDHKIFVQHINFPTVKRGTERLRITLTPCHTHEMIDNLVSALSEVFTQLNIKTIRLEVA